MPRPHLELLAPARDAGIGIEAVNHGADAVYIGGPGFGARDTAGNSMVDIERLARHAHRFGARILVTLNTLLRDDELEPARRQAWQLHEAGTDARIVKDMGLLADAGIRSFRIAGRCNDTAMVKHVTAHDQLLFDALLERRPELARASSGRCRFGFTPTPEQGYDRGASVDCVDGHRIDIGAFDSPRHASLPVGHVTRAGADHFELDTGDPTVAPHNGDTLTCWDRQGELQGVPVAFDCPRSAA